MLKVKNLIKKTAFKLQVTSYTPTQRRIKNPVKHLRWRFLQKQPRTFSRSLFLQKTLSQKSGRVPNTCYKIVVRKFPIYKLKQKRAKKVKN